jgi:hypothetical protein
MYSVVQSVARASKAVVVALKETANNGCWVNCANLPRIERTHIYSYILPTCAQKALHKLQHI